MKVTKQSEHALLVKSFGAAGRLYFTCSVIVYFDLMSPDALLPEKNLWGELPDVIGPETPLDMGMPKPAGEILLTGSCCAPRGTRRPASEISVSLGGLQKRLHVFGDRYWCRTGITDPEPFSEMPVTWQNAFGGEGFERNPLGKGLQPVALPGGNSRVPLPNIEMPGHLIGAPSDRPEPAGFGPIDVMWPQRLEKQGTYDDKWQRERWPHFPDDMDYAFFHAAPKDQWIEGYFNGDESIEILNMHPDAQCIQSHLPNARIRCFVTRKKDLQARPGEQDVFEEVKTRIDTVWLFPGILRGVAVYRGSTEVQDEEYADVRRVFLATESMAETPKSIEHYLEAQKKAMDRKAPIDTAPFTAARRSISVAMKRIKAIPRDIAETQDRLMGRKPVMRRTPEAMTGRTKTVVQNSLAIVRNMEKMATGFQARHGHRVKIDLEKFNTLKMKLEGLNARLDRNLAHIRQAGQAGAQSREELVTALKQKVPAADLAKAGITPEMLSGEKQVNPWHDRGFPLVMKWRQNLEQNPEAEQALRHAGFQRRTIKRAWLGLNPETFSEERALWGLENKTGDQGLQEPLTIPAGLVMPGFQGPVLTVIAIRTGAYVHPGRTLLVDGSDITPLFLPAIAPEAVPVVRVAGTLDAWFVEQEIGDACSVVALESQDQKPGTDALSAINDASLFLIIISEDLASETIASAWTSAYPNAQVAVLPKGQTILEAHALGVDIREWIMGLLPDSYAQAHCIAPEIPDQGRAPSGSPSVPFPKIDVAGITQKVKGDMAVRRDAIRAQATADRTELTEMANRALAPHNLTVSGVSAQSKLASETPAETALSFKKHIAAGRSTLQASGRLAPETAAALKAGDEAAERSARLASNLSEKSLARIEAVKQFKMGNPPAWAKKMYERQGMEPEDTQPLTREAVMAKYQNGDSFRGRNLSGLDLSGLDLHGIDLRKARCDDTVFSESILDNADLSGIQAKGADFSKASLKEIRVDTGILAKAILKEANLNGAALDKVSLQSADLSGADFSTTRLKHIMFEKAAVDGAVFTGAVAVMCVFLQASAADVNFQGAQLTKCLFQKTVLDRADFSGAVLGSTMFYNSNGTSVRFAGADMSKSRMGGQTVLPGADFTRSIHSQACFRDADLSGADFQGARLEAAILENCNLSSSNFHKVSSTRTRFSKTNLEGANMRGVNLFLGSLRKARLVKTDLRSANLYGVDVYKAVLGETRLDGANLKMTLLQGRTEYLS